MSKLTFLLYLTPAILPFLLGTMGLLAKRKEKFHLYFFLYNFSIFLWILTLHTATYLNLSGNSTAAVLPLKASYAFSELFMVFILLFFIRFPIQIGKIKKFEQPLLLYTLILFIITLFTPLISTSNLVNTSNFWTINLGKLHSIYTIHMAMIMLAIIIVGFIKLKKLKGIYYKKFQISFCGSCVFLLTSTVLNIIFSINGLFILKGNAGFIALIFSISTTYSIIRYRFFSIPLMFNLIIKHLILIFLFTSPIILFIYSQNWLFTLMLTTIIYPIFLFTIKKSDIFFKENLTSLGKAIHKIKSNIYKYETYNELIFFLEKTLITYTDVKTFEFFLNKKNNRYLDIKIIPPLIKKLMIKKKNAIVKSEIPFFNISSYKKIAINTEMTQIQHDILVPLFYENYLLGAFGLSFKQKTILITDQDISLLYKLQKPLLNALINNLLIDELYIQNSILKPLIDTQTKIVQNEKNRIQELFKNQSDFISMASHDIKTPLIIARFQLEEMRDTCVLDKTSEDSLNASVDTIISLQQLTTQLFEIQKYDNLEISLINENINLYDEFFSFYKNYKRITDQKNIKLYLNIDLNLDIRIDIDKIKLFQLLKNLLDNSVKFATIIKINICIEQNILILKIIDNGVSIPEKNKKNIFKKFKTYSKTMEGIGLGLYICKKIINLFDGEILVMDSKKQYNNLTNGTTFIVKIPLKNKI